MFRAEVWRRSYDTSALARSRVPKSDYDFLSLSLYSKLTIPIKKEDPYAR